MRCYWRKLVGVSAAVAMAGLLACPLRGDDPGKGSGDARKARSRSTEAERKAEESGLSGSHYEVDFSDANFDYDHLFPLGFQTMYVLNLLKPEARGLRIIIPYHQGDQKPNVGFGPTFEIQGDFEITASYELLGAEEPDVGMGVGANFYMLARGGRHSASLRRCVNPDGEQVYFVSCVLPDESGNRSLNVKFFPAETRSGQLRLARNGSSLRYLVAEEKEDRFRELQRVDNFGTAPIGLLRVEAVTDGARATAEVLWKKLEIRGEQLEPMNIPLLRKGSPLTPAAEGPREAADQPGKPHTQSGYARPPRTATSEAADQPGKPHTASIKGTVLLNGQPVAEGKLVLHPQSGEPVTIEIADGAFEAQEVPHGQMRVVIKAEAVPARYSREETTGLTVEVHEGNNVFDFALVD
jgi:hypothetical protein